MQKQLAMFRVERVYLYLSSTCLISSLSSNSVKVGEPSRLSFSSFFRWNLSVLKASTVSAAFPALTFWRRSISLLNSSTLSATRGAAVAGALRSKARVCDSNCFFERAAVAKGFQCLPNEPSFAPPKGWSITVPSRVSVGTAATTRATMAARPRPKSGCEEAPCNRHHADQWLQWFLIRRSAPSFAR